LMARCTGKGSRRLMPSQLHGNKVDRNVVWDAGLESRRMGLIFNAVGGELPLVQRVCWRAVTRDLFYLGGQSLMHDRVCAEC